MSLDKINLIRKQQKISLEELSLRSGVPMGTLSKITAGITKNPSLDSVISIARALGCSLDDFFGTQADELQTPLWQRSLTNGYLEANQKARQIACSVLNIPYIDPEADEPSETVVHVFDQPAAAGMPAYVDSDHYEDVSYPAALVPPGTSVGIRIRGNSMEPTIANGAIAFVKYQPALYNNEIGVFRLRDEVVCKRFVRDGENILLTSDNSQYTPIRITKDYDGFGVVGRVLGWKE